MSNNISIDSNLKKSLVINCIIFVLVLLGTIFMYVGYQFMTNTTLLDNAGVESFKFYTVDSNIIVGIASLIMVIYEVLLITKKIEKIPKYVYVLKYIGVVGVSLTFLVTLLYLAPLLGKNFILLYVNTNLLFHLIVPVLSFISYVRYEKEIIGFKYTFIALISMFIYAIYYIVNILTHLDNGKVVKEYDWYGFVVGDTSSIIFAVIIFFIITYLISLLIYKLNNKFEVKN